MKKSPLTEIPGVGSAMAEMLERLGICAVRDLNGADPQALFDRLCALEGKPVDRCVLYVFRCAVYYASTPQPQLEKCRWWAWKDEP